MKRALGLFFAVAVGLGLVTSVGCGDDGLGAGGDLGADLSATMDLAGKDFASNGQGSDLAGRDFAGVSCGATTCGAGQACCLVPNISGMSIDATCITGTTCGDGGIPASCDGPEDCSGGTTNCCADITLGSMMSIMGMASCTASCPGSATQTSGGGMLSTKLCHNSSDCIGYTGMAPVLGNTNFDRCCGNAALPIRFCAPGLITAVSNQITCD